MLTRDKDQESGHIAALLLFGCALWGQIIGAVWCRAYSDKLQRAYLQLEVSPTNLDQAPDEFAWAGGEWLTISPRIDYGANFAKKRDAEAICYLWRQLRSGALKVSC